MSESPELEAIRQRWERVKPCASYCSRGSDDICRACGWSLHTHDIRTLLAALSAAHQRAETFKAERDVERSRFAFWADKLADLSSALDRRAHKDWGHLRYEVMATVKEAAKLFREYAAGQPSPSNWRVRAEKAEAERDTFKARAEQAECALTQLVGHIKAFLGPDWGTPEGVEHQRTFLIAAIYNLADGRSAWRAKAEQAEREKVTAQDEAQENWQSVKRLTAERDALARELEALDAVVEELHRVVAMSLAHDKGGQQVGPMFPGRMPPSMARHFEKLLAALPAPPPAREREPDACQHGHTKRTVGCASCALLFWRDSAPGASQE